MADNSEIKKLVGSPWQLLNFSDFVIIGLEATLFMLMLQILGMGWHRINLLRATGTAVSPSRTMRMAAAQNSASAPLVSVESN
jgi:hypothetical protein